MLPAHPGPDAAVNGGVVDPDIRVGMARAERGVPPDHPSAFLLGLCLAFGFQPLGGDGSFVYQSHALAAIKSSGDGFAAADSLGSQNNDSMHAEKGKPLFDSNHAGGVTGGLSSGADILFRVAVKPVPSIFKPQQTVRRTGDFKADGSAEYESTELQIKGRHDVCLCPRIVPVVEAMTALVLADFILRDNNGR